MTPSGPNDARLAIDIGGTFTDVVVESRRPALDEEGSHHAAGAQAGVIEAIGAILDDGKLRPADIGLIIHGTTLATNALIERKVRARRCWPRPDFATPSSSGPRAGSINTTSISSNRAPLVPRHWRIPIVERVAADGEILRPLEEQSVLDAIEHLRRELIESVAVAFLHSYAQPRHEQRVRALLQSQLPTLSVSLSSEVSPEMREYERSTTTCANAYVQPLIAGYLTRLTDELRGGGFACPMFLMLSSGGLTTVETAKSFPIRLVEFGPAGGAIFAQTIARRHGATRVVSVDMGGTTAKLCLIDDFKPQTSRIFEVDRSSRFSRGSGMPVRIPVIEMVEIGAGGGSIARIDPLGRITVGPGQRRLGAGPGLLSPRRDRADGHRRRCGARPDRRSCLRGRPRRARPGCGHRCDAPRGRERRDQPGRRGLRLCDCGTGR